MLTINCGLEYKNIYGVNARFSNLQLILLLIRHSFDTSYEPSSDLTSLSRPGHKEDADLLFLTSIKIA
jgi:hypothetical protein